MCSLPIASDRAGDRAPARIAVSFIVPAFNEERLLGATLLAIQEASRELSDSAEIIVVDDASTDGTAAIAQSFGAQVVSVHCRQIAAVRNAGARRANGAFLIFVDADTIISAALAEAAVAALHAGAVGGGCEVRFEGRLPLYARFLSAALTPVFRALRIAAGCFLFCSRKAFDEVGGFDEELFAAEEIAMSRSLRRMGEFVILPQHVTTSGRKVRTHSAREIFSGMLRLLLAGPRALRRREGLEFWYAERRDDRLR